MRLSVIGRWVCLAGIALILVAALRPISGSQIMGTDVSLDCGPALTAWLGLVEPRPAGPAIIWPGSDLGVGRAAWCDLEARTWVWPVGLGGLATLCLGAVLVGIGRRRKLLPIASQHAG